MYKFTRKVSSQKIYNDQRYNLIFIMHNIVMEELCVSKYFDMRKQKQNQISLVKFGGDAQFCRLFEKCEKYMYFAILLF
jgi:hypothetical protein